jgi:hypothetical protein
MSRYTHFTKLKHLIFLNGGSRYQGRVVHCWTVLSPKNAQDIAHTSTIQIRASIIESSQLAIKIKIVYLCLVGEERIGERKEVGSHARASYITCS